MGDVSRTSDHDGTPRNKLYITVLDILYSSVTSFSSMLGVQVIYTESLFSSSFFAKFGTCARNTCRDE